MNLLSAWLTFRRRRWHVIYPNGVCSRPMLYEDAAALRNQFGGRISKS